MGIFRTEEKEEGRPIQQGSKGRKSRDHRLTDTNFLELTVKYILTVHCITVKVSVMHSELLISFGVEVYPDFRCYPDVINRTK